MTIEMISILVTVFLAFLGYIITHQQELSLTKRKERLELVNKQLDEFYGPLYVSLQSSKIAMQTFFENKDRKSKAFSSINSSEEWRNWIVNVLLPLNTISEKVILEKAYLISEADMPSCLLQFVAHASAYRALIKQWEQGDLSQEFALITFPEDILTYITQAYQELKIEQLDLIGKLQSQK